MSQTSQTSAVEAAGGDAPVAELRGIAIEIGGTEIVTQADLAIDPGESVGLVGESGSGKSVTCRAFTGILGFIGGNTTRGHVLVEGNDMTGATSDGWRQVRGGTIALIPQASLAGLDPVMKVGRQMAEVVRRYDNKGDVRRRSLELLDQVQMPQPERVLNSYPHELSGGMRQRAMIAMGIAGRPKLLIADEPTTALDATVQQAILDLLRRLRDEMGMALLLVSHDLGAIRSATDRVAVMYAGTLVESGRSSDVLHQPRHPYSAALIASDPSLMERGERLRGLFGDPPQPGSWPVGCRFQPRCAHAQDRCQDAAPELVDDGNGHLVACVRSGELEL